MDMMWLCRHHFLNLHMTIQAVFCSNERILFFLSIIFTSKYYAVCKDTAKLNVKESHHQKTLQVYATATSLHSSRLLDHYVIEVFFDFRQFGGLNIVQLAVGMHLNFPGLIVIAAVAVGFYRQLM